MPKKQTPKKPEVVVVDLFCGVGGLTHGFVKEGFTVAAGIDTDASCRFAYEQNNNAEFVCASIEAFDADRLAQYYPDGCVKILVGCAPCQPFSKYTNRYAKELSYTEKWGLLIKFGELIKDFRPDIVSMENVPELLKHKKYRVYDEFIDLLTECGYDPQAHLVYCRDYGIPQKRRRLVVLGSRYGRIELLKPTHEAESYRTVKDAISHLNPLAAGETDKDDPLHRAAGLSATNLNRIKNTPEGGSWKDWDKSLVAKCHKRKRGKTYVSVYGRMLWDEPSPTMTTQCYGFGNGRFGHPEQHRAISLREAACLQTFPEDYSFTDPSANFYTSRLGRQIGNAVPVTLGRVIAKSIKNHLETNSE